MTISSAVVTINPSGDLDLSTEYYIQIPVTAFDDSAGNSYAGISDTASWSFTTAADSTAPSINSVSIPNVAMKVGETITVTITVSSDSDDYATGSGAITGTIGGFSLASLNKTNDTTYTATFTIADGGSDVASGNDIPVSMTLTDSAGNTSTAFTTAISQASDSIDANKPTLSSVNIASNNSNTSKAKVGDEITLTFTANETLTSTPTATIATQSATVANTSGNSYTAKYTMTSGSSEGAIAFTLNFTDSASNEGTQVTAVTDSSSVTFDKTAPTGHSVTFTTDPINSSNQTAAAFSFASAETATGTAYSYNIDDTNAGTTAITGTGTISTASDTISTIDVSSLDDDTLTLSVVLTDSTGNIATVVTDTVTKNTVAATLTQVTAVSTPSNDTSPDYVLSASAAGTLAIGGSCGTSSSTTVSASGNITLTLTKTDNSTVLDEGTYSDCTVKMTDANSNETNTLTIPSFTVDTTAPTLSTLSPSDDATGIGTNSNLVITLNETVVVGTGDIVITKTTGNVLVETIAIGDAKVSISGTSVTINPDTSLDTNTQYYVQIAATALDDSAGNSYAGISDTTRWSFTTAADSTAPIINSVSIPNVAMKVGDTITVTVTVPSDSDDYTSGSGGISGTVGGFTLGSFVKVSDTSYTATFTVTDNGTDVASSDDIPLSISLTDSAGNAMTTGFTTPISQNGDGIEANQPTLAEVTAVTTPSSDTTPDYTFSSDEAGTISYAGDCDSSTTSAVNGNNTITFNTLSLATHSNCALTVTDSAGNASSSLAITAFTIAATVAPEIDVKGSVKTSTQIEADASSAAYTSIASGDTSPRSLDGTDFGTSTTSKTFTIENTGNADLILSGTATVSLSSNSSSAFTISTSTSPAEVATTPINGGSSTTFKINYTAEAGTISTATVIIANNDSDEGTYSFNIQGGESSATIPPRAEKLRAFLAADTNKSPLQTFQNSGGNIQFAFDIVDSDGAGLNETGYGYTWTSPNGTLSNLLNGAGGTFADGTVTSGAVIISSLTAGDYPMSVSVSDSTFTTNANYVSKIDFVLKIVTTVVGTGTDNIDTDGDGIVDASDDEPNSANNVPARLSNGTNYVSKVPIGYRVTLGTTASSAARTGLKVSNTDLSDHGDEGGTATNTALSGKTVDHVFDYIVEGVAVPNDATTGNNVTIVLPLETALTASSTFHKYNATGGWTDFSSDATNNKIEWADWDGGVTGVCPDPDPESASYNNTVSQVDKTCLQITIQDGGANDQDGTVNGTIVDPFGIATPTPVVSTGGGSSGGSADPCANTASITSSTPNEGNCDFINYFILSLEPALTIDASVDFQTRDGSAKAGEDYIKTSGTVTMKAGQTQLSIPVTIISDTIIEDDESFELVLTHPTGATFPVGVTEIVTTHTILNDDSIYANNPTGVTAQSVTTEGASNHVNYFQLALDKAYDHDIIVSYHTEDGTAKAGEDYIALSRKVKIDAGETQVLLGVTIIADSIAEEEETFSLIISNPIGEGFPEGVSEIKATHTILDDD